MVVAETRAIKRILELVLTENIVVAVGSSGCGKSIAIRYVALQLQNQNQYDIIPVYSPDEIRQYYNPLGKQVFVIDDMCGKPLLCMDLIRKWDILSNDLNKMFERSDVKILSSCRKHIYQDKIFQNHSFFLTSSCDFASEYRLTYDERTEIAHIYLNAYEISCLDESIMSKFEFFPLLCRMYRKQNSQKIQNFFCNPFLVVKEYFTSFIDVCDKNTLATMTLFIIYNNDITENFFMNSSNTRKVLRRLSTWFGLEKYFSLDTVKSELDRLAQSYVKKINNSYRLIYDEIYDILLMNFAECKLDLVIKVAHPYVIRDRFLFESLEKTKLDHDNIGTCIKIPPKKEKSYFNRLLKDIKSGYIIYVLLNKQMKHCRFYNLLIGFLSGKIDFEDILHKMTDNEKFGLFVSTIHHGYYNTLPLLLKYMGKIKSLEDVKSLEWYTDVQHWYKDTIELLNDPESSKLRGSTSTTGYFDIVKSLLNHKCDLTVYYKGKTALSIAVQKGYFDIAELLLNHKDDMRHCQARCKHLNRGVGVGNANNSTTRKYIATNTDVIVIETSMFYQIGCDYPFSSGILKCIFDLTEGLLNTVLMSLPALSENYYSENPLYKAAKNGFTDEMQLLLEKKADPDIGLMGEPPLFIAVQNGRFDAVKLLLKYEADPNIKHWNETALHIAAKKGYAHIVELLLENKADPNIEGMFGIPMLISVSDGKIDIKVKQEFYATVIQVKCLDSYTTR